MGQIGKGPWQPDELPAGDVRGHYEELVLLVVGDTWQGASAQVAKDVLVLGSVTSSDGFSARTGTTTAGALSASVSGRAPAVATRYSASCHPARTRWDLASSRRLP
jgi:hypothetical protein